MEEVALQYFRGLSVSEKKALLKKIVFALTEDEKVELAKILLEKK